MKYIFRAIFSILLLSMGLSQITYLGLNTWSTPAQISMSGAGGAVTKSGNIHINPALIVSQTEQVQFSLARYPASIQAQSLRAIFKFNRYTTGITVDHLSYGTFAGYDSEGNSTGNYDSQETHLQFIWGLKLGKGNMVLGVQTGIFSSQLESYQSLVWTYSPGILITFKELDATIGMSLKNNGKILKTYTSHKESMPKLFIGSFAKQLAHLPLELSLDFEHRFYDNVNCLRVGGIFQLTENIQFKLGTSSDKMTQRMGTGVANDFLSGSGVGLAYSNRKVKIESGTYFFGANGWITAISFTYKLQ